MEQLLLDDVLRTNADRFAGRVAATFGRRSVTFGELELECQQLARTLSAKGIGRGDRVVWWGATCLEAIPLWFALGRVGAACVPVNPKATPQESDRLIAQADPALVVSDEEHPGQVTIEALLADRTSTGLDDPKVDETDPHVIFFTSGSSGQPKGVEISHRASRLRLLGDANFWPTGPVICMMPQFHMAGWYGPMNAWVSGDHVVYVERADAESILPAVDEHRIVRLYAVPAVWRRILEADRSSFDLSCLRFCDTGTSATSPELLRSIADAFPGTETSITYGSTEAGGVCRLWPQDVHRKPRSVGPPTVGTEIRLGDGGEMLVRNPCLMNGYFRNPEATSAALEGGWYHTGDLAERDDEGHYSIVGRASELIRTGGETVAPVEVDGVLMGISGVVDIAVAGVPHEDWGEVITAFVVPAPGTTIELEALRAHCEGKLASFKHPRRMMVVDELPRTGATRQIQRRILVQWATEGRP